MFAVASVAALLLASAQAQDRSCADFCRTSQYTDGIASRPECACEDEKSKQAIVQVRQLNQVPTLHDSAIYYAPSGTYSHPTISFAESPFYIVNPASQRSFKSKDNRHANTKNIYSLAKPTRSVREKHRSNGLVPETNTKSEKLPLYLDIDIQKGYLNERPIVKDGMPNFLLSEKELIECVDLYITIFSRKGDIIDKDLEKIWEEEKIIKYQSLTDLDLMIEIQNKCRHPANIVKDSLEEITTSRPRKRTLISHQSKSPETNIPFHNDTHTGIDEKTTKVLYETPTSTEITTKATQNTQKDITYGHVGTRQESTDINRTDVEHTSRGLKTQVHASESKDKFTNFLPVSTAATLYSTAPWSTEFTTSPTPIPTITTSHDIFTVIPNDEHSSQNRLLSTIQSKMNTFSDITRKPFNKVTDKDSSAIQHLESNKKISTQFYQTTEPTSTVHWTNEQLKLTDRDSTLWPVVDEHTTQSYLKTQYYKQTIKIDKSENDTANGAGNLVPSYDLGDVTILDSKYDTSSLDLSIQQTATNIPPLNSTINSNKSSRDTSASESNVILIAQSPRVDSHTMPDTTDTRVNSSDLGKHFMPTTVPYWTTTQPYHSNLVSYWNIEENTTHGPSMSTTDETDQNKNTVLSSNYSDNLKDETDIKNLHIVEEHVNLTTTPAFTTSDEHTIIAENIMVKENKNSTDIGDPQSLAEDNKTSKSLSSDLGLVKDSGLTTSYMSSDHVTTENILKTEWFPYDTPSPRLLIKNKKRIYPEEELEIPKITIKEFYNDTVLSEVKGFEYLPNDDFKENVSVLSQNETAPVRSKVVVAGSEKTLIDLEQSGSSDTHFDNNTFSEVGKHIIGKLFFLFDEELVPAKFVQNSDGQIKVGIDGYSFCDKFLDNSDDDSVFMVAICKCLKSEKCKEVLDEPS